MSESKKPVSMTEFVTRYDEVCRSINRDTTSAKVRLGEIAVQVAKGKTKWFAKAKVALKKRYDSLKESGFEPLAPDVSRWAGLFGLVGVYGDKAVLHHPYRALQTVIDKAVSHAKLLDGEPCILEPYKATLDKLFALSKPFTRDSVLESFEKAGLVKGKSKAEKAESEAEDSDEAGDSDSQDAETETEADSDSQATTAIDSFMGVMNESQDFAFLAERAIKPEQLVRFITVAIDTLPSESQRSIAAEIVKVVAKYAKASKPVVQPQVAVAAVA